MEHKPIKSALCTAITFGVFACLQFNIASANTAKCLDSNTLVCITETNTDEMVIINTKPVYVSQYTVTNMSDQRIYGFAVTNTSGAPAQELNDRQAEGWKARTFSSAAWNSPSITFTFDNGEKGWIAGDNSMNGSYAALGSFSALFIGESDGAVGDNVNFYWNSGAGNSELTPENPLNKDVTIDQFYFYGSPESNFAAFDLNGSVIASSITTPIVNTSPVPEPSTYLLLLVGLGIITIRRNIIKT